MDVAVVSKTVAGQLATGGGKELGNLAATYRELGRVADALPLEERVRQIRQHPH